MFGRLPAPVAAEAAAGELGRLESVHRTRRCPRWPVVWAVIAAATVVALSAAAARQAVPALGLVPLTLLGVASYAYLLPPAGGRRWAAVYEHGLVLAVPEQGWARALHWDDVVTVEYPPGGGLRLVLNPTGPRVPIDRWLHGFPDAAALAAAINRHVPSLTPPRPAPDPDRAAEQTPAGPARRGPLPVLALVLAALLPALAYPALSAVGPRPAAAGDPGPAVPPAPAATPTATIPAAPSPTARPPRTSRLPTPDDVTGYAAVCTGATFSGAPPYTGRGPHPIEFADVTPPGPAAGSTTDSGFRNIPFTWRNYDPSAVQLVACATRTLGLAATHCRYEQLRGNLTLVEPVRWADYTIVLRAARTGTQLARFQIRGRGAECLPIVSPGPFGGSADQYTSLTLAQMIDLFDHYVDDRFPR